MPEYLAPGVYVEEVSFRAKSIEGVSTTTTGFVGPSRFGPVTITPDVVTGQGEYERIYGGRQQLEFQGSSPLHNFMWHAVRAFFAEGGKRLYISRTFLPLLSEQDAQHPGCAQGSIAGSGRSLDVRARFPGLAGDLRVRVTLQIGQNILGQDTVNGVPVVRARGVLDYDLVLIRHMGSPLGSPTAGTYALAESFFDAATSTDTWRFRPQSGPVIPLSSLVFNADPSAGDSIQVVTMAVTVYPTDPNMPSLVWSGLALDRRHQLNGTPDSVEMFLSENPSSLGLARSLPIVVTNTNAADGIAILSALFEADDITRTRTSPPSKPALRDALLDTESSDLDRSIDILLTGGNDGQRPDADTYDGIAPLSSTIKTGLKAFEDIDDISIVAAPGSTFGYQNGYRDNATTIIGLLITHCTQMRYRIAVLDSGEGQSVADVRAMKSQFDSTYAALYYPWITILDPVTRTEINIPPSGAVCGIYARNDINRGVYKAPANEVVNIAIGFETPINKAQQDVLNPLGVNCFRFFEGRGYRLWGARTISSDQEWKYVNLRRYFAYLEHSIDKGTQFAVFEPNGDLLWANVRRTIEDFLLNEFMNGALLGDKPEKAYFVRCDRSTMTQNDLDNGRLVCLIGVSPLRPAEYVIFRIGQWTGDHK